MKKWFSSLFGGNSSDQKDNVEPKMSLSEQITQETSVAFHRLPDAVKAQSSLLREESLPVYQVPLEEEQINITGCRRNIFGNKTLKNNRTIMVMGATGAGKSTLIDGMINYILGVQWKDDYRFKLVKEVQKETQAVSQTSEVTVYKLNHQDGFQIDSSLTIIDTPGFGDTGGIEKDQQITEMIRNLFTSKTGQVFELDLVCFVVQASLARLTPSQRYVFDSVLSIFGKDIAENIRVLVTFADGQRPPVLEAITASGVPCPKENGAPLHFKFNNSALFASNTSSTSDEDEFDQMFWNMGIKSMKRFFDALTQAKTVSLLLTKEVLKERQQLEIVVESLQEQVQVGLCKLEEIKQTSEKLKTFEAEISRNKTFEIEVTVTEAVKEDISGSGHYITNCQQCHITCHYPCGIPNDADKKGCAAMNYLTGYCEVCPGKCYWKVHFNQKYKFEYKQVKKKQTLDDLKKKYDVAKNAKSPVEAVMKNLEKEYDNVQVQVTDLIDTSSKSLNRLKEIALKPNPLSTPEYIDMLIEGEKAEAKPGWKQRVESLNAMRKKAETLAKVHNKEEILGIVASKTSPDKDNSEQHQQQDINKASSEQDANKTECDEDANKTGSDEDANKTESDEDDNKTENDEDDNKTESDEDANKTER